MSENKEPNKSVKGFENVNLSEWSTEPDNFPKEMLEILNNPKYFQISSDGKGILVRYSNWKQFAEDCTVEYPLTTNSYGFHIRDEKAADALRKQYGWEEYLYAVNAVPIPGAIVIDPAKAQKTKIRNEGG